MTGLGLCSYCKMLGVVMTVKVSASGFEVSSHCTVCGYECNSDFANVEDSPTDLECEYSQVEEPSMAD